MHVCTLFVSEGDEEEEEARDKQMLEERFQSLLADEPGTL